VTSVPGSGLRGRDHALKRLEASLLDSTDAQRQEIPVAIIKSFRLDGQVVPIIGTGLVSARAS
jgi:hypothetical protein